MKKYLDVLSSNPLFNGLSDEEILIVLRKLGATINSFSKNEYIKSIGDKADFIGIVLKGTAHIVQDDFYGNRNITASCEAGDMFAEAFAFAGVSEIPVDILSCDDTEVMIIKRDSILNDCDFTCPYHHIIISNLLKIVSRKSMILNQKLKYVSQKTTREKLMAYLSDQAKINHSNLFTIPFDRQALADYLGVERSAMSAEISKLVKEGHIKTKRSSFTIL